MEKLFIRYSGTKANFQASSDNLETKYTNSIVFIGDGECIYTHGKYFGSLEEATAEIESLQEDLNSRVYFSAISAGGTTATASKANEVLNITTDENIGALAVNATSKGLEINLTEDFLGRIGDFEGGLGNVPNLIDEAIGKLDAAPVSTDGKNVLVKVTEVDGKLTAVNITTDNTASAADLEAEIQRAKEAEASAKADAISYTDNAINALSDVYDAKGAATSALTEAKAYTDTKFSEEQSRAIQAETNLESSLSAEIDRAQAAEAAALAAAQAAQADIDDFMKAAEVGDAAIDTLKEIQEYIASDAAAAAELLNKITAAQNAADNALADVDALEANVSNNYATKQNVADDIADEAEARAAADSDLSDRIDAINTEIEAINVGVTSFGGKTGAITIDTVGDTNSIKFSMSDNKLVGEIVSVDSANVVVNQEIKYDETKIDFDKTIDTAGIGIEDVLKTIYNNTVFLSLWEEL